MSSPVKYWTPFTVLLFLPSSGLAVAADPLFAGDSILDMRIEAPIRTIMRERPDKEEIDGKIHYTAEDGSTVSLDVKIRTRGKFRRRSSVCPFAPLRLNVRTKQAEGTVFENQDKLKLVTHCKNRSQEYEQALLAEYLAYRILNLVTDVSYRARLLSVTYVDSKDGREIATFGFLIEADDRLAERIDTPVYPAAKTDVSKLAPQYTNLVSVFRYLIANTDFSPVKGPEGEECCHNHTLFGRDDQPIYSTPYDFDQSGLVDAPHAAPNPRFKLRSVRQRLYRGRCKNNGLLEETLGHYRAKRQEIVSLVEQQPELSNSRRKKSLRFIDAFYKIIDDPDEVEKRLTTKCI